MHHVIEGTPQELAPYLAQRPNGKFRLIELDETATPEPSAPVLSEKSKAAIALLDTWIAEGLAASLEAGGHCHTHCHR